MLASTLFSLFGPGVLGWIVFNLAVYALPVAIALSSGLYVYETGNGVFLSLLVGLLVGGLAVVLGELAFKRIQPLLLRIVIGLVYAVPTGITEFHAAKGLSSFGGTGVSTVTLLSRIGALFVGGAAWTRVSRWSEAGSFKPNSPSRLRAGNNRAD